MSKPPIRILLVDDHPILRQGMRQLLETSPDFQVVGEAGDGEQAVVMSLSTKPDIVLMDINLPKVSGYEATRAILTTWPQAKVLILSNQDDPHVIRKCLALPIQGFLLKDIQIEDLMHAMQRIHQGERLDISPEIQARLDAAVTPKGGSKAELLTEREREVVSALRQGYSNQKLADLLVVSPKTVQNHLYSIYQKIGVRNRAEAILWAIDAGL